MFPVPTNPMCERRQGHGYGRRPGQSDESDIRVGSVQRPDRARPQGSVATSRTLSPVTGAVFVMSSLKQ